MPKQEFRPLDRGFFEGIGTPHPEYRISALESLEQHSQQFGSAKNDGRSLVGSAD